VSPDRDLERAAERFADTVHEDVSAQVRLAWALERDRMYAEIAELRRSHATHGQRLYRLEALDAEIAELRDELHTLAEHMRWLNARVLDGERLHSVKVEP